MLRINFLAVSFFLLATIFWATQAQNSDQTTWAKRVSTGTDVVTNLQFYFHDTFSGSNPSAVRIAQPSQANAFPTGFGNLVMIDDPLTIGPDPSSKEVGRARGMYGSAAQNDMGLLMAVSYGFTDGIYAGSSFSLLSINPAMQNVREMAIVGGTGLFRMARGYAIAKTYSANAAGDAVVGYNVTIVTYV